MISKPSHKGFFAKHPASVLGLALVLGLLLWVGWLSGGLQLTHRYVATINNSVRAPAPSTPTKDFAPTMTEADRASHFAEVGQTGDAFGGINALLTAFAGALVAWAGFMQHLSLSESREEVREERRYRQKQEFESLFFKMLDLSRDLTDRIEKSGENYLPSSRLRMPQQPPRYGASALDSFAASVTSDQPADVDPKTNARVLVQRFQTRVYNSNPSAFGPYFRLLFQAFKHISESTLEQQEKIRYANIARGQISEGAVLLLALNGLTPSGHRFIRYIEEFGLLEHMHTKYLARHGTALKTGYRPRAFLGSAERQLHAPQTQPIQGPDDFVKSATNA